MSDPDAVENIDEDSRAALRAASTHLMRWDLDKTYLDTDFDGLRALARTAIQTAQQKVNVPGSRALLRALGAPREGYSPYVTVISGSPEQLRAVLEEKLDLERRTPPRAVPQGLAGGAAAGPAAGPA